MAAALSATGGSILGLARRDLGNAGGVARAVTERVGCVPCGTASETEGPGISDAGTSESFGVDGRGCGSGRDGR